MNVENDINEWVRIAKTDMISAQHLNDTLYPKPLEIICYHCQQAAEKMLKALVIACQGEVQKTHDLGLLTDQLSEFISLPNDVIFAADDLTEYGVKIRYPIEAMIEETHVAKALSDMKIVCDYVESELQKKIVEINNDE